MDREIESVPKMKEQEPSIEEITGTGSGGDRIRCPLCKWSPVAHDRWTCSCHHSWHTFETGGVCPKCLLQWMHTQCPKCLQWSAHSAWYPQG